MSLNIEAAAYSHIGGRKNNEDSFFLNGVYLAREKMDEGGQCGASYGQHIQIYAVCDGMGGAMYGEEASFHAAKRLGEHLEGCANPCDDVTVKALLNDISDGINLISERNGLEHGASGSTISMLMVQDGCYRTVNVGDSRVYLLRGGVLRQLTKDHSHVQELIDRGIITAEEGWQHPQKNIITQHLGMDESHTLRPDISRPEPLLSGDRFLICSDGLSDVVRDSELEDVMKADTSASTTAEKLVRRAIRSASELGVHSDNITVVCLNVNESDNTGKVKKARRLGRLRKLLGVSMALVALCAALTAFDIVRYILR